MVYGLYPKGIEDAKDMIQAASRKHAITYFAKRNDMTIKNLTILYEIKVLPCPTNRLLGNE